LEHFKQDINAIEYTNVLPLNWLILATAPS
jgi:hypothetical protein